MNQFMERYKEFFKKDFEGFEESITEEKPIYFRINTLKITEKELIIRLKKLGIKLEKVPWLKYGYKVLESSFSLASTNEYLQGYFYIQDAASQAAAEILDPKPNELVLDMTAAPGSKTTHIAQLMENTGQIIATDESSLRLTALKNNMHRLGISNVLVYKKDSRFISDFKLDYDKVLLDAPCSGNYYSDKKWFDKRLIKDFKERQKLQKELIKEAIKVLKPKGTLVYSTCSLEPEENEEVIDWALDKYKDKIKLKTISLNFGQKGLKKSLNKEFNPELTKTNRFLPHLTKTDAFFIAKIEKL